VVEPAASLKWALVAENSKQIKKTTGIASRETTFPVELGSKNVQVAALLIPVTGKDRKGFAIGVKPRIRNRPALQAPGSPRIGRDSIQEVL